jgi:hypothetical protein
VNQEIIELLTLKWILDKKIPILQETVHLSICLQETTLKIRLEKNLSKENLFWNKQLKLISKYPVNEMKKRKN